MNNSKLVTLDSLEPKVIRRILDQKGIVLLQNIDIDIESFEAFSREICGFFHHPGSRYQLHNEKGDRQTTNVPAGKLGRLWHAEGHYYPYPFLLDTCLLYCAKDMVPHSAATTLVDGYDVYRRLPVNLRERFDKNGIIYEMYWEPERWQVAFNIENLEQLEGRLKQLAPIEYRINDDDSIFIRYACNAINRLTGNPAFTTAILGHLSSIPQHYKFNNNNVNVREGNQVFFGDGEPLSDEVLILLIDLCDKLTYEHFWQCGDLLIFDNNRFMHGRGLSDIVAERPIYTRFGWRDKLAVKQSMAIEALLR